MNIKAGQGFKVRDKQNYVHYGLILFTKGNKIGYVPVVKCDRGIYIRKSFEDNDAQISDKNNVRLNFCPPPFSELGTYDDFKLGKLSNSMAIADLDRIQYISKTTFIKSCAVLDGGKVIDERDMYRVWHHGFLKQPEREKIYKDRRDIDIPLRDDDEKDDKGIDLGF